MQSPDFAYLQILKRVMMLPHTADNIKNIRVQGDAIKVDQLPGPSGLPLLGNLLNLSPGNFHRVIEKWSDKYGSKFKIKLGTIPVVIFTDPEAIQFVLKNRPDKFRRRAKMDAVIRELGFPGVFNAEGDEWKRQRKVVSQALNLHHLKTFFPTLVAITKELLNRWNAISLKDSNLDIKSEMMCYTVDITSRLAFGYDMNTLEKKDDTIQNHLEIIFPALFKRVNFPIPYWKYFKFPADKKLEASLLVINDTMEGIIDENKKKLAEDESLKETPTNFLQALLVACDHEDFLSNKVIIGNVITMLLAGEDTTAHTLTWIFYFMHLHPEVQQKMQQEADKVLKNESILLNFEDTTQLPYIEAVAFETMRLKPVGPVMFFDTLEEVVIEGVIVPKNTGILLQTQYATINEKHFSHSDKFMPERWLGAVCPVHNDKSFVPFGAGPRFCPGYHLAMIEIKAVLSMVCKNFIVTIENNINEIKEKLAFTMMPSAFDIRLKKRN